LSLHRLCIVSACVVAFADASGDEVLWQISAKEGYRKQRVTTKTSRYTLEFLGIKSSGKSHQNNNIENNNHN
jgi:hypothetical protein